MAELTETALNEAADVMEAVSGEVLDAADTVRSLSGRDLGIGLFFGALIGGAAGVYFTEKRLRTKYERLAEEEIDSMREHFRARMVAKEEKPELSELGRRVEELGYRPASPPVPGVQEPPEPETKNIFEETAVEDTWDMEAEKASRSPKAPYVIHIDERHETSYSEATLTYYVGDDVLCDEKDKIIEDQDLVVGLENLDKFGHGSGDANIVYIRNDDLAIELEVIKSERTYAEDVHGMTHSDAPMRRRRTQWDE
jgi:signal recognition particle subunit SEC65